MDTLTTCRMIVGNGTSEQEWQQWMARHPVPVLTSDELVNAGGIVHVVAPHPDDEVLGCAGIIQQFAKRGLRVKVWAVTDGECSHDETPGRSKAVLADIRTQESLRALSLLHPDFDRSRIGIPDGEVTQAESELSQLLTDQFNDGDTVIAPWYFDGHPDHEAASRASHAAAQHRRCRFLEVPIWGWHWVVPSEDTFPAQRAIRIELTADEQRIKSEAIQHFQSQLRPDPGSGKPAILPDFALARLARPYEVLFR